MAGDFSAPKIDGSPAFVPAPASHLGIRRVRGCEDPRHPIRLHSGQAFPSSIRELHIMSNPAVSIQEVNMIFGQGTANEVQALKDITLTIQPNEFISLIGPSGCGKSTLLRVMADLVTPTSGDVAINGKTAPQARLDRDYGMVFQAATLYEWRTVAKNVQLPLELMKYSAKQKKVRTREMLELVELGDFAQHYPWQLSGGMQQRVAIARALTFEPSILLMDEPFGALDEFTREKLNLELLRIVSEVKATTIFVTHNIAEAIFLADEVYVMTPRPGQIAKIVPVNLPRPRELSLQTSSEFNKLVAEVRETLGAL